MIVVQRRHVFFKFGPDDYRMMQHTIQLCLVRNPESDKRNEDDPYSWVPRYRIVIGLSWNWPRVVWERHGRFEVILRRNIDHAKAWPVDRDGRVRTDKDRPVVLKAKPRG